MVSLFFFALGFALGWALHGSKTIQWIKRTISQ